MGDGRNFVNGAKSCQKSVPGQPDDPRHPDPHRRPQSVGTPAIAKPGVKRSIKR